MASVEGRNMWSDLKNIKRFTTKEDVDRVLGIPKFQLENHPVYYYGNGFIVGYSSVRFRIEEYKRVEYGEKGEFAITIYHFPNSKIIMDYFNLTNLQVERNLCFGNEVIEDGITYDFTFHDIHNFYIKNKKNIYYREGENRVLIDDRMKVNYLFIYYDRYMFFFYGKSKKNKISCFKYTLEE